MIFLVALSRNMIFLFPENMVLFFRRKMKDGLSQKNTWKYDIFFKCLEKIVFPKKIALEYDLSCVIWKDSIFSPENMIFLLWKENARWSFSRNTWKYDICINVTNMISPFGKKNQRWSSPEKIKTDWHSRLHSGKSSNYSLYFYELLFLHGDLHRCFHILLSSKKDQET